MRDGLEDLEYMFALEELLGSRAPVLALVDAVVSSTYEFEHDPLIMLKVRNELANNIESELWRS